MNQLIKLNRPLLRVAHQNEVLQLRNALATLQAEMKEMKKQLNHVNFSTNQRKITLSSNGQYQFVSLRDIIYCEADGNYTKIFIQNENKPPTELESELSAERSRSRQTNILISKTLKSVVDLINSRDFIRCHQSYLVNKKHVVGYSNDNGLQLTMTNEKSIPVSRRHKKKVLEMHSAI